MEPYSNKIQESSANLAEISVSYSRQAKPEEMKPKNSIIIKKPTLVRVGCSRHRVSNDKDFYELLLLKNSDCNYSVVIVDGVRHRIFAWLQILKDFYNI